MAEVTINERVTSEEGWRFDVTTSTGTEHTVMLGEDYYRQLTDGEITPEQLIRESFAFLLDNEPANAILSEFDLRTIEDYFPAYPDTIQNYLE